MKYRIAKRINPLNNESKFYPAPQYMEELTLMDLAKDISDACTLNVTDVDAVLTSLLRKLPMYLKSGFKNQLGNFGRMQLSFSSKGFDNSYCFLKSNKRKENTIKTCIILLEFRRVD